MHILLQILLLAVGFVCLVKGADMFVGGSSALARTFNVPGLIIGLTIVALGTSAPEMAGNFDIDPSCIDQYGFCI